MMVKFIIWLVVEPYPSEKYDFVSWDDFSIPYGKIKFMFQSPPTRYHIKSDENPVKIPRTCVFFPTKHSQAQPAGRSTLPSCTKGSSMVRSRKPRGSARTRRTNLRFGEITLGDSWRFGGRSPVENMDIS
jgi:hypothetical protein